MSRAVRQNGMESKINKHIAKETVGQYEVSIARVCNLVEFHSPMDHSGITRISHRAIHAIEKKTMYLLPY